jgi:flagellar biosynthesis protein FlhB
VKREADLQCPHGSAAHYFLERGCQENEMKMSRQDQMDELKEMEGNPAA